MERTRKMKKYMFSKTFLEKWFLDIFIFATFLFHLFHRLKIVELENVLLFCMITKKCFKSCKIKKLRKK